VIVVFTADIRRGTGKGTAVVSMDLSKAFDRVWRESVLMVLRKKGVRSNLWLVLREWYRGCVSIVKWQGEMSEEFASEWGVGQGRVLGPLLFNIWADNVAARTKLREEGVQEEGGYLKKIRDVTTMVGFADDWTGLNDWGDEKEKVERVKRRVELDGGALNVEKSVVVMVEKRGGKEEYERKEGVTYGNELKLGGITLQVGRRGGWDGRCHWEERCKKTESGTRVVAEVLKKVDREKKMMWRKVVLEKKIVPMLLYGAEVVEAGKSIKKMERTIERCGKWLGADENERRELKESIKKNVIRRKRRWEMKMMMSERKGEVAGRAWKEGKRVGRGGTGWHRDFRKVVCST